MSTEKIFSILLLYLSLATSNGYARSVSLKKTGGNLATGATSLFPGYTPASPTTEISWDELTPLGSVGNWTDIFKNISDMINNDPDDVLSTVEYEIVIDAPNNSNPVLVGKQNLTTSLMFAQGQNIIDLEDASDRINKVTVTATSAKAYLKYESNLYYGSWLKDGQSFTFYTYEYDNDENLSTPGTTMINSIIFPNSTSTFKIAYVINGTSGIITTPFTNSSGNDMSVASIASVPLGSVWREVYGEALKSEIGYFFAATNCNNITVEKIDLDGNNVNSDIGGVWGDAGIQLVHSGIYYADCMNSNIKNVNIHHMGLDGAYVRGSMTNTINLDHCYFEYNGRQGLSWLDGIYLTANYCSFSNTGRAIHNSTGLNISTSPASGLDLEPGSGHEIHDGIFDHCNFDNNVGHCVVNDDVYFTSFDMKFNHCTFTDIDGYGLLCTGNNFTFFDCDMNCPVLNGYNGSDPNGIHKYTICRFEDKPFNDGTNNIPMNISYDLLDLNSIKNQYFKLCTFKVNDNDREFGKVNFGINYLMPDWVVFEDCNFIYNNDGAINTRVSRMYNVKFKGNTIIQNIKNGFNSFHHFSTNQNLYEGSDDPCHPNLFEIDGQVMHCVTLDTYGVDFGKKDNLTDGYFKYEVKNKGLLYIQHNENITIGKNAILDIMQDGSYYEGLSNHSLTLNGSFIAEANSYLTTKAITYLSNVGMTPFCYIDNTVNTGLFHVHSAWSISPTFNDVSPICSLYVANSSYLPCIQGGNSSIVGTNNCSTPLFTNITTSGPLSVIYNTTNVPCYGQNSGSIELFVNAPPPGILSYNLNGSVIIPDFTLGYPIISGLSAGSHVLTVTNASGCSPGVSLNVNFVITQPTALVATISANRICSNFATAGSNGGTGQILYSILVPIGTPTPNVNSNTGLITNLNVGIYTVIATDGNLCTSSITLEVVNPDFCCSPLGENLVNDPLTVLFDNATINTATSYTGQTIYINGTLTLSDNLSLTGCTVYFTPNALIIDNGFTLNLDGVTMLSACNEMWKGISSNSGHVNILNSSTIKNMKEGVIITDLATLTTSNSFYHDNYIAIQLKDLPVSYSGTIEHCEFKTLNPLLAPYALQPRGEHGIMVENCRGIHIGNPGNPTTKNKFVKLFNGIYIFNSIPIPEIMTSTGIPEIVIHADYNTFEDIIGGHTLWTDAEMPYPGIAFNKDYRGCAIFGFNKTRLYPIKLFYTGNNNAGYYDFNVCQKAILVNSFSTDIENAKAENVDGGILQYSCEYHKQRVINNTLHNTYLGVLVNGNSGGGSIDYNTIHVLDHADLAGINPLFWGKGIELNYFTNTQNGLMDANHNTISSSASDWIIGLNVLNSPSGKRSENQISFTTTSNTPNLYAYPVLRGIQIVNCINNIFEKNTVMGMNNADALTYRRSTGVYMERNRRNTYNCNVNDYLYDGAYIIGRNEGNYDQFNNNKFRSSWRGILLRHLVDNGTLGDIGSQAIYNANNKFYDLSIGSVNNNKRVHRITTTSLCSNPALPQPTIFTNSNIMVQNQSSSNMPNTFDCRYKIQNDQSYSFIFECVPGTLQTNEENDEGVDNINRAVDVAADSVMYSEYAEVGRWMDELELYGQLDRDDSVRLTHPILDSFYNSHQESNFDLIYRIDRLIGEMSDSTIYAYPALFTEKLLEAQRLNDSLNTSEYYVQNEYWVNAQYFIALQFGMDSLNAEVKQQIGNLAMECPYVAGKAVFKLRTLHNLINPLANYDDLQLCNNAGVYKNGTVKGLFDDENNAIDSLGKNDGIQLIYGIAKSGIKVYPNPASQKITIKYNLNWNESGLLIFYDLIGNERIRINLSNKSNIILSNIPELCDGVYTYKYLINNRAIETGKLSVVK